MRIFYLFPLEFIFSTENKIPLSPPAPQDFQIPGAGKRIIKDARTNSPWLQWTTNLQTYKFGYQESSIEAHRFHGRFKEQNTNHEIPQFKHPRGKYFMALEGRKHTLRVNNVVWKYLGR